MHIRYQGFQLYRLWRGKARECSGWLIRAGQEPLMLSRQKNSWTWQPVNTPWEYSVSGQIKAGYLDPDFNQLACLLYRQQFPSRYQALQALRGALISESASFQQQK